MHSRVARAGFFRVGGGTLPPDDPSYVVRAADRELLRLVSAGECCTVFTAPQMGKSSLLVSAAGQLRRRGVQTAIIDLADLGTQGIMAPQWYLGVLRLIRQQLGLQIDEVQWWRERHGATPAQRFVRFVREELPGKAEGAVAVFIDGIDSTRKLEYTDDFFLAIRAIYDERASNRDDRRLAFVLAGVVRPVDLVKDEHKAPDHVGYGHAIDLGDFTDQEAAALLPGLADPYPVRSEAILQRVLYWTGGHPYLTQQVCGHIVAQDREEWSDDHVDKVVGRLFLQEGQVHKDVHLHWVHEYVGGSEYKQGMLSVYQEILAGKRVQDEERSIEKSKLKLSGLVKAGSQGFLQIRNHIYRRVFGAGWAEP